MAAYENSTTDATAVQDEIGTVLLSSGPRTGGTAAHRKNDDGAAYRYHYSEGLDEQGGARTTMTRIDGAAAGDLYLDVQTAAARTKNGAPCIFFGAPTAAQTKDNAACLYSSVRADAAASQVTNGAPVIFSGARAVAQNEDVTVYLDYDTPAAAKNRHGEMHFFDLPRVPGFAAGRGEMLPYQTLGYYNSGMVTGEALPLASKVFGCKTASVPSVAVGGQDKDKVAGSFTEGLRRGGLPVLGVSLASLAVTALAAGEPTPAAGFGLFLILIVGLSAVTISVLRA